MKVSIKVSAILTVFALIGGCGSDAAPASQSDEEDDEAVSEARDAGRSRDAGRRASDARVDVSENDEHDDDDQGDDDSDGGKATGSDAGKVDASIRDAGVRDAGIRDAGIRDAAVADGGRAPNDAGASACDTLTYASFGQRFMTNYCVSCHSGASAQKGVRLDTLAGVTAAKSKVKSEVGAGAMPPPGIRPPTTAERGQLTQWIDCGPK